MLSEMVTTFVLHPLFVTPRGPKISGVPTLMPKEYGRDYYY